MEQTEVKGFTLCVIPTDMIPLTWPLVEPFMQKIVEQAPDELTLEKIRERLLVDEETLLTLQNKETLELTSALTCHVQEFDTGKKVLNITLLAGGNCQDYWKEELLDQFDAIARRFGCSEIRGLGARRGWLRYKHNDLYKEGKVTVVRTINKI